MTINKLLTGFVAIILLAIIIFIIQNLSVVPVKFLFWSFEMRRVWLVFSLYSAGLMSGLIVAWFLHLRHSVQMNKLSSSGIS